jgi:hypothetical protein
MGTWVSTSLMQIDMGFTYMGIFWFSPQYMDGNMGFTYIGTWCFLPTHYMGTWVSSLRTHGDMRFYHPHIDGEHDAAVDSTGKL